MVRQAQQEILRYVGSTPVVFAEVGVYEAEYAEALLSVFNTQRAWFIDSWEKTPTQGYAGHDQAAWDEIAARAIAKISKYPNTEVIRATSVVASAIVPDNILDFVYLDGSHFYERVVEDINLWFPKVKLGGWVSGDDFPYEGVDKAVREFAKENTHFEYKVSGSQWWFRKSHLHYRSTLPGA